MFSIVMDVWQQILSAKPAFISTTPHFNFITVHYFWIIGMAIFGSICLYPNGGIAYIDALFLASGCATQSGLNTVNINALNTWQQIVIYLIPMATNPITVNTFVVFLRLYWFEKRFQHISSEAKKGRRSIARSFTKPKTNERDIGAEERGVNGREIKVMHNTTIPNGMTDDKAQPEDLDKQLAIGKALQEEQARSSRESSKGESSESGAERLKSGPPHQTQIKFADQVKRSDGMADEPLHIPMQRTDEEHIAFLERQRNPEDTAVLRIPGPRDAEAGVAPQAVDDADDFYSPVSRRASTYDSRRDDRIQEPARPRNITVEEPTRSPSSEHNVAQHARAVKHVLGALRLRKPRVFHGDEKLHEDDTHLHRSRSRIGTFSSQLKNALSREKEEDVPYLSWEPTVGRNSAFVDLTEAQREELGGIEYRSLKSLALVLVCYFWGFTIFGIVCLTPWILEDNTYGVIVEQDGQGRPWWGIFTSNSAFTDLGYTLTPDSMISFQTAIWPLLLMSFLIIIGNTGFPIMLRIVIWITAQYVPKNSGIWEELKFLLDHPRRCFTLLFPSKATWWLLWILIILNGLDLLFFIVLDLGNTIVTELPVHIRVLDGWFQAVSTRTAGFGVVNLAKLHPAIQVSYLIMMYISVLPIAISVRRTNVYEEKSLGIYGSPTEENEDEGEPSYVGAHLRRQLSFDLWYIFLGFFIIAISEGTRIQSGDPAFTMFNVLFEVVSAYGTVGLSLGYTNIDASFSAEFGVIAKLVIIAMQIRGRHRGLPYELDRAILLPSEHLQKKEAHDAAQRARRRSSAGTMGNGAVMAPVSSGAAKIDTHRSRSRSKERKSTDRQSRNFLSSLLHPGPSIPDSHRYIHKDDPSFDGSTGVGAGRHSIATLTSRRSGSSARDRGRSPPRSEFGIPFGGNGIAENTESGNERRVEGRRFFHQERVNPPPRDDKDDVPP